MNKLILFFVSILSLILVGCTEKVEKDESPVLYSFNTDDFTLNEFKADKYYGFVNNEELIIYSLLKDRYEMSEEDLKNLEQEKDFVTSTFKEISKDVSDETELEQIKFDEKNELFYVEYNAYLDTFFDNVIQVLPSEVDKLKKDYYLITAVVSYFGGEISENTYKTYLEKIKNINSLEQIYELDDLAIEEELDMHISYQELTKKTLEDVSQYTVMDANIGDVIVFEATPRTSKMVYKILDKQLATDEVVYEDLRNDKASKLFVSKLNYLEYFTTLEKEKFTYNKDIFNLINE